MVNRERARRRPGRQLAAEPRSKSVEISVGIREQCRAAAENLTMSERGALPDSPRIAHIAEVCTSCKSQVHALVNQSSTDSWIRNQICTAHIGTMKPHTPICSVEYIEFLC